MADAADAREALWASDRRRVGVALAVTPARGATFEALRDALEARVDWPGRELRWHAFRVGDDAEAPEGWALECTMSCLAHGDEANAAYRVEGLVPDLVDSADVLVSAPCHIPFSESRRVEDVAFDANTGRALAPSSAGGRLVGGRAEDGPPSSPSPPAPPRTAASLLLDEGLAIAPSCVPPEDLARLRAAAERRIRRAERAAATRHPHLALGVDVVHFAELSSRGGERFDLLFPKPGSEDERRNDPDGDAAWVRAFAERAPWVATLVEPLLGAGEPGVEPGEAEAPPERGGGGARKSARVEKNQTGPEDETHTAPTSWWCDASVVYSRPGAPDQDWHCDGRHLAGAPRAGFDGHGAAPPYALCVFVPLIDLTRETGCTRFWVGSHVADGLIGFGGAAGVLRGEVDAIVSAGACVAYDYRTMHRGLGNVSGAVRPVVQFLYARSTYRETKNYGVDSLFGSNEEEIIRNRNE